MTSAIRAKSPYVSFDLFDKWFKNYGNKYVHVNPGFAAYSTFLDWPVTNWGVHPSTPIHWLNSSFDVLIWISDRFGWLNPHFPVLVATGTLITPQLARGASLPVWVLLGGVAYLGPGMHETGTAWSTTYPECNFKYMDSNIYIYIYYTYIHTYIH